MTYVVPARRPSLRRQLCRIARCVALLVLSGAAAAFLSPAASAAVAAIPAAGPTGGLTGSTGSDTTPLPAETGPALDSNLSRIHVPPVIPTDRLGRPLQDAHGARINHPAPPSDRRNDGARRQASGPPVVAAGNRVPPPPGSPFIGGFASAAPVWAHAFPGTSIGLSGLQAVSVNGHTEILAGGTSQEIFGENDFWQLLRRTPGGTNYEAVYVHPTYPSALRSLQAANVRGDARPEIIAAVEDGSVYVYDLATHELIDTLQTTNGLRAVAIADLNADSRMEFLVTTDRQLLVFGDDGARLWQVNGAGGDSVVVGQMDGDASLEIATSSGTVLNAATRAVQWRHTNEFGALLALVDLDGDGRQEILGAEGWSGVTAYDVARKTARWTLAEGREVAAFTLANLDDVAGPELLVADGQFGYLRAIRLQDRSELWRHANPNHGATRLLVADVDDDGRAEIAWGTGHTTTAEDTLEIIDAGTQAFEWHSIHLDGPLAGPALGDLDGDGQLEIVAASTESSGRYQNGRLMVFDAATKDLRALSAPVGPPGSVAGIRDLRLRDIDADGRPEIIVASDWVYRGLIEIYGFSTNNVFTLKWSNATSPDGSTFRQADVADLNGNGGLEVLGFNNVLHSGADGQRVHVYDLGTGQLTGRSTNLWSAGTQYADLTRLLVEDVDGDGHLEVIVVAHAARVFVLDGATLAIRHALTGPFSSVASAGAGLGLYVGQTNGLVTLYQFTGNEPAAVATWPAADGPVTGLRRIAPDLLWAAGGTTAYLWSESGTPLWRSLPLGTGTDAREVAAWSSPQGLELIHATPTALWAFRPAPQTNLVRVELTRVSDASEATRSPALLRIARDAASTNALDVPFTLGGTAVADADYVVTGARRAGPRWIATIPAGETVASVLFHPRADDLAEPTETITAQLEAGAGFILGAQRQATMLLRDLRMTVRVFAFNTGAAEGRVDGRPATGAFSLFRDGPVDRPMFVRFRLSGEAANGEDYRARVGAAEFPAGRSDALVSIVPIDDTIAEGNERVVLNLEAGPDYHVDSQYASAELVIADNEPSILILGQGPPPGPTNAATSIRLERTTSDRPLTVHYLLSRQAEGQDRVQSPGEARFQPGQSTLSIPVPAIRRNRNVDEAIRFELLTHPAYSLPFYRTLEFVLPATSTP